jgi:hypothetical protein
MLKGKSEELKNCAMAENVCKIASKNKPCVRRGMEAMMMAFKKGCRRFFLYIGCILASGGVYIHFKEAVLKRKAGIFYGLSLCTRPPGLFGVGLL